MKISELIKRIYRNNKYYEDKTLKKFGEEDKDIMKEYLESLVAMYEGYERHLK